MLENKKVKEYLPAINFGRKLMLRDSSKEKLKKRKLSPIKNSAFSIYDSIKSIPDNL